jgi:hypothetical protein
MDQDKIKHHDFSKFVLFTKGVIETGMVVKYSDKELVRELKMHFNRLLTESMNFEKTLHRMMGPDWVDQEEEVNCAVIDLVCKIFDMEEEVRQRFIAYMNNFKPD